MGGYFTTPLGNQISYDPNESLSNKEGIFCSFNRDLHDKSIEFIQSLKTESDRKEEFKDLIWYFIVFLILSTHIPKDKISK